MDHLTTSEERRARWYSKVWPRNVPVQPATCVEDLIQEQEQNEDYSVVKSIPMEWLLASQEENWLKHVLDKNGFVVVSNVLSHQDCKQAMDLMWDYLLAASCTEYYIQHDKNPAVVGDSLPSSTLPFFSRHDVAAPQHAKYFPCSVEGGILPFYASGHSTVAWHIRSHSHVVRVFERFWEISREKLVSSLDGILAWPRWRQTDAGWFHLDQNPRHKPDFCAIQGLVNLLPPWSSTYHNNKSDHKGVDVKGISGGGNVLVAQSHLLFPHHYNSTENNTHTATSFYQQRLQEVQDDDWLEIDPTDATILGDPSKIICCNLPEGSMMLWDSRTVHCSYPHKQSPHPPYQYNNDDVNDLIRAATLVSMLPADQLSLEVCKHRLEAIERGRTLTHWANKASPLGEEHQEYATVEAKRVKFMRAWQQKGEKKKVLMEWQDLTEEQQRLVVGNHNNFGP